MHSDFMELFRKACQRRRFVVRQDGRIRSDTRTGLVRDPVSAVAESCMLYCTTTATWRGVAAAVGLSELEADDLLLAADDANCTGPVRELRLQMLEIMRQAGR